MELAEHAQHHAVGPHLGAAAGVEGTDVAAGLKGHALYVHGRQNGLHRALEGEEVHAAAVGAQGQHLPLVGQVLAFHGGVDGGQLVQLGALVAVAEVAGQGLQHGGKGGGAHDAGVLAQGVEDGHGLALGGVGGKPDFVVVGGGDEGVGDDLAEAEAAAQGAQLSLGLLLIRIAALGGLALHQGDGNLVVAVEPGHLLGNVGVVLHVAAPGGDDDGVAVQGEVQPLEHGAHLFLGDVGAQQAVDFLRLQLDGAGVLVGGDDVDDAVNDLAAAQQLHQLAGPLDALVGVHGVQALLVPGGGVGAHAQGGSGAADGHAVEVGGLKDHHGGVAHNLGVGAAHNAGHAHGLVLVADAQHGGGQLAVVAVQGLDDLALPGGADHDPAAVHAGEVKGVHGLAVLQHDVVGDVHDVVDGAHAGGAQPLSHPQGGGGDLHVAHHAGGVPGAQRRVLNLHVQQLGDAGAVGALDLGGVEGEGPVEGGGGLTGQADDAQAVGPVGGDLELHDVVVQAQQGGDVVAGLGVLSGQVGVALEDEDAVHHAVGPVVVGHAQLLVGAQHAVGGLAPQLAGGDVHAAGEPGVVLGHGHQVANGHVLSAGDNLDGLAAHVHLADPHVVGVGVALHGQHLAHHHVLNLLALHGHALHLGAGEGHGVAVLLVAGGHVHELRQPFSRKIHSLFSSFPSARGPGDAV